MAAVIIKASFNGDLRRISSQVKNFEQLRQVLQNLFGSLPQVFTLKYQDDDNDFITITSDIELEEAITLAVSKKTNILRLFIEAKANTPAPEVKVIPKAISVNIEEKGKDKVPESKAEEPKAEFKSQPELFAQFSPYLLNNPQLFQQVQEIATPFIEQFVKPMFQAKCPYTGPNTDEARARCPFFQSKTTAASSASPESNVHTGVTCDGCSKSPIVGVRYKCANCGNFDLCGDCEAKGVHTSGHVFIKLSKPTTHHWYRPILPNLYEQKEVPSFVRGSRCGRFRPQSPPGFVPLLARFVTDVTVPDGIEMPANTKFTKVWRLRNEGTTKWPERCRLIFTDGERMTANIDTGVQSISPGEDVDISVEMVAPAHPGKYVGYYRMATSEGSRFGHRIWVEITVPPKPEEKVPVVLPIVEVTSIKVEKVEPTIPEPVKPVPETPFKYAEALQQLVSMGFNDVELNKKLLLKHKGALINTIDEIIRQ